MKAATLALLLAAAPAFCAPPDGLRDLTGGQYALHVSGMLCWACARALEAELSGLKGVSAASADFDRGVVVVSVRPGATVTAARVRHALRRAESLANLGARYEVTEIDYRIVPIIPGIPDGLPPPKNKARR